MRGLSRQQPRQHGQQASQRNYQAAFSKGHYRAVVIGNNDYRDPKQVWKPLKTAVHDAEAIAKVLQEKYAFNELHLLKNATRRQILSAFSKLANEAGKDDSILVYYAGHGWQNPRTKEAFWVPVDADGADDATFISNARIREKLSVIADNAKHVMLVSDSCFSGTLLNQTRGANILYSTEQDAYFRKIANRKSVQILAAGGSEFVDDNYRGSGHSPLSYFILKELRDNEDKYFTFSNLSLNVEHLVARNVDQTPQSGVMHRAGDEGGQFIFKNNDGKVRQRHAEIPLFNSPAAKPQAQPNNDDSLPEKSIIEPLPTF